MSELNQEYVAQLEQKVAHLTRLVEVNGILNSVLLRSDVSKDRLLSYLMDMAAELTESEGAAVLLWDDAKQELHFTATTSNNADSQAMLGKPVPVDSIAGTIMRERRLVKVDDTSQDPRHYKQVDEDLQFTTRSILGVPLISNDRVLGVLEVVNKKQLPWRRADATNLTMLAAEAAIVIEVAQLVIDLQKANTELSELDKLKSDFIAIASHELRTPLGIILGYSSFLEDSDDPEVKQQASKVMQGALQLRSIIENMINLRYVKQSREELQLEAQSLETLLADLQRDILAHADTGKRFIDVTCHDSQAQVLVDRSRIGMALNNIINNAIAFTQDGGSITVEARVVNDKEAYITVTDDGIGIEEHQFEEIFKEFYQVEDHTIRHHGGLGIGLSISKAVVLAHNGKLWASSPGLQKGATFTVSLPLMDA